MKYKISMAKLANHNWGSFMLSNPLHKALLQTQSYSFMEALTRTYMKAQTTQPVDGSVQTHCNTITPTYLRPGLVNTSHFYQSKADQVRHESQHAQQIGDNSWTIMQQVCVKSGKESLLWHSTQPWSKIKVPDLLSTFQLCILHSAEVGARDQQETGRKIAEECQKTKVSTGKTENILIAFPFLAASRTTSKLKC